MGQARYRFAVGVRYFATIVQARAVTLPSVKGPTCDGAIRLIKVVLATPFELGPDDKLRLSRRMEAVVWVRDDAEGRDFLDKVGVTVSEDLARPSADDVHLWVMFGEPGGNGYQPITGCEPIPAGQYEVPPVAVADRAATGLVFPGGRTVTWRGKSFKLRPQPLKLLQLLHRAYPGTVSAEALRRNPKLWREGSPPDYHTIDEAVSGLRRLLRESGAEGISIPPAENKSWCLALSGDADQL